MSTASGLGGDEPPDDASLDVKLPGASPRMSRSPHPYHRSSSTMQRRDSTSTHSTSHTDGLIYSAAGWTKSSRNSSDSGTEADDESTGILRGLPAPPHRPRKGLRPDANNVENHAQWLTSLAPLALLVRPESRGSRRSSSEELDAEAIGVRDRLRIKRRIELLRRLFETALLASVGAVVLLPKDSRLVAWTWRKELASHIILVSGLYAAYPLCLSRRRDQKKSRGLSRINSFSVPSSFDPAPLLYPILLPIFVSLSLTHSHVPFLLPNITLSLCSLPPAVIPAHRWVSACSISHWLVTLVPILVSEHLTLWSAASRPLSLAGLDPEVLPLLFPLHQALIPTLDFLLRTSILPAELQLLTTAMINLLLFATSPQAEILKALLWLGGVCVFLSCRHALRWEVALARIPSWKFRRLPSRSQSPQARFNAMDHKVCEKLSRTGWRDEAAASDSDVVPNSHHTRKARPKPRRDTARQASEDQIWSKPREPVSAVDNVRVDELFRLHLQTASHRRRHTLSTPDEVARAEHVRTTPSGRRKRSMTPTLASFLSLTAAQALVRKWLYALYVYAVVFLIILGPVRSYISNMALQGAEPVGWALGYLFGNITWFRFWVVMMNFDYWIRLPPRVDEDLPGGGGGGGSGRSCTLGRIEHIRHSTFGQANTRLVLSGYCFMVLITGLAIVFKLSTIAEVDTRRKIFHGMMVLMFLPTIYIDPAFCALALALVLCVFLLLDLFRASQLPPISRPLTYFLAPYVDGRDHRGPVIVSHIFLLIGCSIPLWLSLADVSRAGIGPWEGWEVPVREVSMVSGVICVGMGDAAASLIGRRYGRLKWFWGGGKSLEGSVAFLVAVFWGLMAARLWLDAGRWPVIGTAGSAGGAEVGKDTVLVQMVKAILAAGGVSATEAILTGCNDNVVVPIVLWLLVRGLGL